MVHVEEGGPKALLGWISMSTYICTTRSFGAPASWDKAFLSIIDFTHSWLLTHCCWRIVVGNYCPSWPLSVFIRGRGSRGVVCCVTCCKHPSSSWGVEADKSFIWTPSKHQPPGLERFWPWHAHNPKCNHVVSTPRKHWKCSPNTLNI